MASKVNYTQMTSLYFGIRQTQDQDLLAMPSFIYTHFGLLCLTALTLSVYFVICIQK